MQINRAEAGGLIFAARCPAAPGTGFGGLSRPTFLGLLVFLIALLVGVVWVLPGYIHDVPAPGVRATIVQPPPSPPTESETARARAKREAERTLQELLHQQAILEAEDVAAWAGEEYEKTMQVLAAADAAFGKGQFELAGDQYEEVVQRLQTLRDSKPQRLENALNRGAAALTVYDQDEARRQFEIALALSPDHAGARSGARRAQHIARLGAMLTQARKLEQARDWPAALERYQAAVQLDAESPVAGEGLERVQEELERVRFSALMSDALVAVNGNYFEQARATLEEAAQLRPDSREVRDALIRLELAFAEFRISAHRERADTLIRGERWHEAVSEFEAVLAIDSQAQFAVLGLSRSRRLAALHDQLDKYIAHPGRLQSREPRTNLRELLISVESMDDKGPRLSEKLTTLDQILEQAETPVEVPLRSDGLTEVSIDRVGDFGRFEESTVTLLPGEYVARGVRLGYRDVRVSFTVEPGATSTPLTVRCEEAI